MRRLLFAALLLAQLAPFAGAGVCLRAVMKPKADCSMPMQGDTQNDHRSHSDSSQECARVMVCAPAASTILPVAVQLAGLGQPVAANYTTPVPLLAGDPITPPQPPPIA